jgi:hypothetical protein
VILEKLEIRTATPVLAWNIQPSRTNLQSQLRGWFPCEGTNEHGKGERYNKETRDKYEMPAQGESDEHWSAITRAACFKKTNRLRFAI